MKCRACDEILTKNESVKKDKLTNEYLDLCTQCQIMSVPEVVEAMESYEKFIGNLIDIR